MRLKRLGTGVVSFNSTVSLLSFTRLSRRKKIFWKTFTDPLASGAAGDPVPGATTMRSIVKPAGSFSAPGLITPVAVAD